MAVFVSGVTTKCSQDDFKVCTLRHSLPLSGSIYFSPKATNLRWEPETSGSLGRLCRKEGLVQMASDREIGALLGKASG